MTESVIIAAYPKSGSTYLSRLLADILDCPTRGILDSVALATEGEDRTGDFIVYQTHLKASYAGVDYAQIPSAQTYNLTFHDPRQRIVHLVRDPRAVAVSAKFYWELESFQRAIEVLHNGWMPIGKCWVDFVTAWQAADIVTISYEDLVLRPRETVTFLLHSLNLPYSLLRVMRALKRQEINVRRKELAASGDKYPYSSGIQSKNLRVGKVDDWKNYLTLQQSEQAIEYFREGMQLYGYLD